MNSIEFSDEELNALVQLIDIAIKSQGLNVAQAGVILAEKVREASSPPTEVESDPQFSEEPEQDKD